MISDQKMYDIPNYERALETDKPAIVADTLEELAEKIGVPSDQLLRLLKLLMKRFSQGNSTGIRKTENRQLELHQLNQTGRLRLIKRRLLPTQLFAPMFSRMAG